MLELDTNKRFIREFDYMNLDAVVIEILFQIMLIIFFLLPFTFKYNQYLNKNNYNIIPTWKKFKIFRLFNN